MKIGSVLIPDRPIAFNRDFARLGIGVTGALMLSQAVYWSKRTGTAGGWFYKTQTQWEEETALSRYEQETARRRLKKLGILEEKKQGIPCKVFYRVNAEKLAEGLQTSMGESSKLEGGNPTSRDDGIQQSITENTQRLQTETTESAHTAAPNLSNPTPEDSQSIAEAGNAGADSPAPTGQTQQPPAGLMLNNHPMFSDWKPARPELVAMLRRSAIALPVCECLAGDPELLAGFVNHHLANPGREHTSTGWTGKLATWLTRDWQRLGRPTSEAEYHQSRGTRPDNLPPCPLEQLHALWQQELGHLKPTPPLADWQKSKSARRLADRWADGFTTALANDSSRTRYQDPQTGLHWWQGFFQAIANSPTLKSDDWFNLIHLGNPDTFADVTARLAFERQQGGAQ